MSLWDMLFGSPRPRADVTDPYGGLRPPDPVKPIPPPPKVTVVISPIEPAAPPAASIRPKVSGAGKATAAVVLATAMIASFEGLRTKAYLDIAGVPTVCYGETLGVTRADVGRTRYTETQCLEMLRSRVIEFNVAIRGCVKVPMNASREAALTSFAYNVGVRAACGSTAVRLINAGRAIEGCQALMRWNKVAGVTVNGLTRRRAIERDKCLKNEG